MGFGFESAVRVQGCIPGHVDMTSVLLSSEVRLGLIHRAVFRASRSGRNMVKSCLWCSIVALAALAGA